MNRIPFVATAMLVGLMLGAQPAVGQNYNIARGLAHKAVDSANARSAGMGQEDGPQEAEPSVQPAALIVEQIVEQANYVACYQGADRRAHGKMTIVDPQGQKLLRDLTILRRDTQPASTTDPIGDAAFVGDQKLYACFESPAEVSRMALLVHKHLDRDDDRWLYLPQADEVKRIEAADRRSSFAGSHFVYEDVVGRNISADKHELLTTESDDNFHVVKNTPKGPAGGDFAYYKMWIHRQSFVVVQARYYDAQDKEIRRYDVLKVQKDPQYGYATVTRAKMSDLRSGGYSEMEYTAVSYNVALPDDVFAEASLRTAPSDYLK